MSAAVKPSAVFWAATTRVLAGLNSAGTSSGFAARARASWHFATIDSRPSFPAGVGAAAAVEVAVRWTVAELDDDESSLPHPATAAAARRPSAIAERSGIDRYETEAPEERPAASRRAAALSVRSHV